MADKQKIALVISSTRPTRWADKPAAWLKTKMEAHAEIDVEVVDLRDYDLPFFNAVASNAYVPLENPEAIRFHEKIKSFDAYVFVVAEYNRSITADLKNAFDWDYTGWNRKPMGLLAYGSVGGARASEQLRMMAIELQMVPVRNGVHIGGSDFYRVGPYNPASEPIEAIEGGLKQGLDAMLDEVVWYSKALKAAKAA